MSLFDNARSVVMNNKVVRSIKTTDGGVIYEKTDDTYLTIDVPLSLIYSDAFSITGALTDYYGDGLSGKSVDLLVGSTVVDSTTTTTNGAYSFTSTPVRTGNHEFKVVFNGDSSYDSSESVTVSRVVGKETSVIVNQTDMSKIGFYGLNENVYSPRTYVIKLVTDDNENIVNARVTLNGFSAITDENGEASQYTWQTNNPFSVIYDGDENYAPCSLNINIPRQIPTVIQVTGDSVIQKEESTTLTVTVLDQDGDVIPNCTLSYSAKHGSTDVASGTLARTNNNGQTSVSYTGTGIGDVDFTFNYNANGTLLQETYELTDGIFVDIGITGSKNNNWYTSNMSVSTDSIGTTLSNTAYGAIYADDPSHTAYHDWNSPFIVECDIISFENANLMLNDGVTSASQSFSTLGITANNHLKVVNTGSKVKWFIDGEEKTSLESDISSSPCQIAFRVGGAGGNVKYKNFVIYPI